jgi:hypothetical protein
MMATLQTRARPLTDCGLPAIAWLSGVHVMALVFLACIVSGIALSLPVIRSARALGLI